MKENIVVQRQDPSLKEHETICPFGCINATFHSQGSQSTEYGAPKDGVDPNHHRYHFACDKCGRDFSKESCRGNVWYTTRGRVLRGSPNCPEDYYTYICNACGGDVRYVTVYTCQGCGIQEK